MIARSATIDDLAIGQEVIYLTSSQYRPAPVYHGIVRELFDPIASNGSRFRAVVLDTLSLPTRFFIGSPLFIVGS